MKKILAAIIACVMLTGALAACKATPSSTPKAPESQAPSMVEPAAKELNVGVFYYNFSDVYISSVRTNVDAQLKALNAKFTNYDGATNQATQTDQINTAITNGTNLLIVNIVETSSPDAAQGAVDAAKAAGIPIIFFNREVADEVVKSYESCAFVGTNAPEAGHMQGKMIGDYLMANYDKVDLNGDGVISYVMFKGQEGNAEAEFRTQFAVEDADNILKTGGKPALKFYNDKNASKYLVDQAGNWSAQASNDYMNTILAEYSLASKNMVELIIANNDGMAEGAVSGLQTIQYNTGDETKMIPVFGVDATDSAKQLIKEKKMTGTIKQDAEGMAATIAALTGNIQKGAKLMDNTASFNVDTAVAKIRVPYGMYTGE